MASSSFSSSSLVRFCFLMILLMILFTTPKSLNARKLTDVPPHGRSKGVYNASNSHPDGSVTGEGNPTGSVLVSPPTTNTSLAYSSGNNSTCKAAASATTNAPPGPSSTTSSGAKCTAGVGNQNVDSTNNSTACKAEASAHSSGGGPSSASSASSCSTGIGNQNRQNKFNSPPGSQGNVPFPFPPGFP